MQLEPYSEKNGYRCWLNRTEQQRLLDAYNDSQRELATRIMLRAGLRSDEVPRVSKNDLRALPEDKEAYMLRVHESKRGYHETAIPTDLADAIRTAADYGDLRADEPIVDRHPETIQRWVDEAAETVANGSEDGDWQHVSAHDCRRTWATYTYYSFGGNEVALDAVCQFGGWSDVETVRANYIGRVPDELVVGMMADADLL